MRTMADMDNLSYLLSHRRGIHSKPKRDGRVEIPQGIVRLMGWKDGDMLGANSGVGGSLFLFKVTGIASGLEMLGLTSVSMGRVRIPKAILRAASIDGPVVVVPDSDLLAVVVWKDISQRWRELEAILGGIGQGTLDAMWAILGNGWMEPPDIVQEF